MSRTTVTTRLTRYYHYHFGEGYVFSGHTHEDYEVNLILRGSMNIMIGDRLFRAGAGEIYLTAPWVFHHNRLVGESAEMIVVHFGAVGIDCQYAARRLEQEEAALAALMVRGFDEALPSGWSCADGEPSEPGNPRRLLEVLLSLTVSSPCNLNRHSSRSADLYAEAVRVMQRRLTERLTVAELAGELHVSPTVLKSAFSETVGKGAMEYFTEMKIGEAKRLLEEGKSIPYVGDFLGFSSQNYFSTVFKRILGMSPKNARG